MHQTAERPPASDTPELAAVLDSIRAGKTDGVAELTALLERHPDSPGVMGNLAWALAHQGRHEEAIALSERYLHLVPDDVEMKWRIADRLVNLGRLDEALARYRAIREEHPDCEDALMGARYMLYLQRQKDKSGPAFIPRTHTLRPDQKHNLKLNRREFRRQRFTLRSLPPRLYLESTTRCNFCCRTCSKGYGPYYAEDLRGDVLHTVRRELMPVNVLISITGFGEPTLSPDFDEILDMGLENGSKVHFVTNASLLNFERLEKLTRCPVDITISVDGAKKETFESIRAGSNFDLTLEKLAMIKKLRDIHLSGFFSIFCFNFVAIRENIHELADVVRLAHRYGIPKVHVADYAFISAAFDEQSLRNETERANREIARAVAVAGELGLHLKVPPEYIEATESGEGSPTSAKDLFARLLPVPGRFARRCSSPWSEPYIFTNGKVSPCCASTQYLGDLGKSHFLSIWNGWRYRLLRWRIHTVFPPPQCRTCFVHWGINGGNAGSVMTKEGLLIPLMYRAEAKAATLIRRVIAWLRNAARGKRESAPPPEPNYFRGQPLSAKNQPQAH